MYDLREITMEDLFENYKELCPDAKLEDIFTIPISRLIAEMEESEYYIDKNDSEFCFNKHAVNQKKKAHRIENRIKEQRKSASFSKQKKKWKERRERNIPDSEESNNRTYIKKLTSKYTRLKPKSSLNQ